MLTCLVAAVAVTRKIGLQPSASDSIFTCRRRLQHRTIIVIMGGNVKAENTTICRNKKADREYEILDTLECGLVLEGAEVKSLRERAASLDEAYARIERGELWLIKCHIAAYRHAHAKEHDPTRRRKLLAHAREIRKLKPQVEQKGLTLVPLRLYFNERGIAKVTIALARGKRLYDKRQNLRLRDDKREMERAARRRK